jgi:hypothetical protein
MAHTSICRKENRLARRPTLNHARHGEQRSTLCRANTDGVHWRAPAVVDRCGFDPSTGVRTATASSPSLLHRKPMAQRPVHKYLRHGARARRTARRCARGVALGSQPQEQLEEAFPGTLGIAAWGGKDAAAQPEWRVSSSVLGEMAVHRRSAAQRCAQRHVVKVWQQRKRREGHGAHSGAEV